MKKLALSLLVVGSFASADFLSVSAGAGVWQENISGYVKSGDNINYMNNKSAETDGNDKTGNLGLADKVQPYIWAKIIHPIPVIPNVKLQYTRYSTSGDGIVSGDVKIFGRSIADVNTKAHTDLNINSYDATFFYEIKPVVADIEAGFGVNVLDSYTKVKTSTDTYSASAIAPIPYLYARAETMQLFGFSIEAQGKYLNVSSKGHYYDYTGALKYHLPFPVLDISASLGYRYQDILGKDGDDETKLQFKGAFAELGVKF
jgi:outer membrane protein